MILRVVSQYCLGILWDWHIFTWFFIWGNYNNAALAGENWFWVIEWTPAFIGSGILVGLNTAISFVVGEIIAYGIIGPALVHNRIAFGEQIFDEETYGGTETYDRWKGWVNFAGMTGSAATTDTPSPRFWLLWPGVLLMICVSFAELALQYKIFVYVSKGIWRGSCAFMNDMMVKMGKPSSPYLERQGQHEQSAIVEDSAEESQLVS